MEFVKPLPLPPDPNYHYIKLHSDATQDACKAAGGTPDGLACTMPPPPPPPPPPAPVIVQPVAAPIVYAGGLVGGVGYSLAWGNCVNQPGVNNPGWGNPIAWPITSHTPWIGASALFFFNHVAVVTGIYPDGSIEVAQQNSPGAPHHYAASEIRGYR